MSEDLDDTVIIPPRPPTEAPGANPAAEDVDNTIIVPRSTTRGVAAPLARSSDSAESFGTGSTIPMADHRGNPAQGVPNSTPGQVEWTPVHYRFRVGAEAESIPLDVPAYIGRRPSSPRIVAEAAPRLVTVRSPQREVSSTHLEVRQVGASVVITDLRSTNGSVVSAPGAAPRKLRQGESVVVSPGTLVDIGDGNIVEILPRRLAPGSGFSSIPDAEG